MICRWSPSRDICSSRGRGSIDPNFWRTVVLVGEHGDEGALGVVLNRTSESRVDEALPELAGLVDGADAVHVGGPVQPSAIVVLAEFEEPERAGTLVLDDIGFLPSEVDPDALGELRRARVFAGYAGWGPGQLDGELEEGSWIVEPAARGRRVHERPRGALERRPAAKGRPVRRPRAHAARPLPELRR